MKFTKDDRKIILVWEKENDEDVEKAKMYFNKLTKQGWLATKSERKLRILEFKPEYGELWFIPLSEGG